MNKEKNNNMSQRIMKNFPIEYDGQTYWRSRSCAVAGFVFCQNKEQEWYVLVNKRGPGAPNYVGKWNAGCGYLDFNENGQEAVARETFEEMGVKLSPDQFKFVEVHFSNKDEQNVTCRYICILENKLIDDFSLNSDNNEQGETTDIQWVKVKDIDQYEWAFDHDKIIKEYYNKYVMKFIW